MHSFDRILLSAFEFDVHAVIKESRYYYVLISNGLVSLIDYYYSVMLQPSNFHSWWNFM